MKNSHNTKPSHTWGKCGFALLTTFIFLSIIAFSCVPPPVHQPDTNTHLAALSPSAGTLVPQFDPAVTDYRISLAKEVDSLTLNATAESSVSTVSGHANRTLVTEVGWNKYSITVTAESGAAQVYNVSVDRAGDYESSTIGTLKYVPCGTFQRDAGVDNLSSVSAFRMAATEVTRAQFLAVCGFDWSETAYSSSTDGGANDPVQNIPWYAALYFCNKLSIAEGFTPVYSIKGSTNPADWGAIPLYAPDEDRVDWDAVKADWKANGYRLPTEMERLWAAMGADTAAPGEINRTGYGKRYSGGSGSAEQYGWFYPETSDHKTRPVAGKLTNELGIYDMSGNVHEMVWDLWSNTWLSGSLIDYHGSTTDESGHHYRIHTGGSFMVGAPECYLDTRFSNAVSQGSIRVGFRVIRR